MVGLEAVQGGLGQLQTSTVRQHIANFGPFCYTDCGCVKAVKAPLVKISKTAYVNHHKCGGGPAHQSKLKSFSGPLGAAPLRVLRGPSPSRPSATKASGASTTQRSSSKASCRGPGPRSGCGRVLVDVTVLKHGIRALCRDIGRVGLTACLRLGCLSTSSAKMLAGCTVRPEKAASSRESSGC